MAHAINQPFELVQKLTIVGVPAPGLTDASFPLGTVQLRKIDPTGPSPAPVSFTGGTEFTTEELWAGSATYVFKFKDTVAVSSGLWAVRIQGGPAALDELIGVVRFEAYDLDAEVAWLNGKNVVGVASDHDSEGNATQVTIYGFDTAADADLFADNPAAHAALVRIVIQKDRTFRPSDGYLDKYVSKVP